MIAGHSMGGMTVPVAALPRCAGLIEPPGIGHMTPVEAPELVSGKIRELVSRHVQVVNTTVNQTVNQAVNKAVNQVVSAGESA